MFKKLLCLLVGLAIALPSVTQDPLPHPWAGKKVAFIGDSITDPRNKAAGKKYWDILRERLGITPWVYAVSGRQWDDVPRQAGLLASEHGDDVDAIIIFMGTNDYNNAVPLGRWYDERMEEVEYGHRYARRPEARMKRTPSMDPTTYRGRINIALDSLKRSYPTKQIVLLTPIHRSDFHANEKNWQCSEEYQNRCGEYLQAYVDAVKEAGQVWSIPVIDLSADCGLYPLHDEMARYFNDPATDRLHPNDLGHQRMGATLLYRLSALPCTWE
ncbi:MAG: SGNH/GDSL hydrolase family protein [Duncaniella sp.]|nr:SGNH/GDSL hydrolase family protein [Duncaniella sp.]